MTERVDSRAPAQVNGIAASRGLDFTGSKRASLERRVLRRVQLAGCPSAPDEYKEVEGVPERLAQPLLRTAPISAGVPQRSRRQTPTRPARAPTERRSLRQRGTTWCTSFMYWPALAAASS